MSSDKDLNATAEYRKRLDRLVYNLYDANCAITIAEAITPSLEGHPLNSAGLFWPYVNRSSRDFALLVLARILDKTTGSGINARRLLMQVKANPRLCTRTWQRLGSTIASEHIAKVVDPWITWLEQNDVVSRIKKIRDKHLAHDDDRTGGDLSYAAAVVSQEEVKHVINQLEEMVNDIVGLIQSEEIDWHFARQTAEEMTWIMKMCAKGVEARRRERRAGGPD